MNEKKYSELINEVLSDKHIEEASGAEAFFSKRKMAALKRKRALKMLPIIAACFVLILSLGIGMMFLDENKSNSKDDKDTGTNTNTGTGNWFENAGNNGNTVVTPPTIDPGEEEWSPWDEVKYFAMPNSKATINVIDVDTTKGFKEDNGFVSDAENAVGELSISLAEGSAMLLEYTYTGSVKAGVKFALNKVEAAPAEGDAATEGDAAVTEAYEGLFVYVDAEGKVNVAKITAAGEEVIKTSTKKVAANAKIAINWNGKDKVIVSVNGAEAVNADATVTKASGAVALVADAAGAKFSGLKATLEGTAIEFETRSGTTWSVIEEEGKHKDSLYTGYAGISAADYKCMALVSNMDLEGATKITISGKIAVGKDWGKIGADGKRDKTNQNCGFIVNVWNTNGEGDTSPLVYENQQISFMKVFLGGTGLGTSAGKWGPTKFSSAEANNNGKWRSFPVGEEVKILEDGPKADDGKTYLYQQTKWTYGEYYKLTVEWDAEARTLTYWVNDILVRSYQLTKDIFMNNGSGVGISASSGDTYFREVEIVVE